MAKGRSTALGRVYASLIHSGRKKLNDCPKRFIEDIKESYYDLYGVYPVDKEDVENAN